MTDLLAELDSECLVLNLKTALETSPSLEGYPAQLIDNQTLEVQIKKGESVNQLFELLNQMNIEVLSMRNKSNRLEQLFLNLVHSNKNNQEL